MKSIHTQKHKLRRDWFTLGDKGMEGEQPLRRIWGVGGVRPDLSQPW